MKLTRALTVVAFCTFTTIASIGVAGAQEVNSHEPTSQGVKSIGPGLVRLDSAWAGARTKNDGSQVLTLAKRTTGQWMGEVGPQQHLVVRDINIDRLVRVWNRLGHRTQSGVKATLTWNTGQDFTAITVSNPKVTRKGYLQFRLAPGAQTPSRMADVTVNLTRSQSRSAPLASQAFPVYNTYALTATASTTTTNSYALQASVAISDSGLRCYQLTLSQPVPTGSLPKNLQCGSLSFSTGQLMMSLPSSSKNGSVLFTANMVASGTPFAFNAIIASWSTMGN